MMTNTGNMEKTVHQGHNLKRFREMLGVKQDALALDFGAQWSQKKISLLEQKEVIDPELLEQIADILKVPAEAIRNFDEEQAIKNMQHDYPGSDNQSIINIQHNYQGSYNQGANVIYKSMINATWPK